MPRDERDVSNSAGERDMSPEFGNAEASLPNFFIAGAARSGTTALADILGQHPSIFITKPKEPHFLAFAGRRLAFCGPGDDLTINMTSVTEPSSYFSLYRGAGGISARGDASVSTLYYAEDSLANLDRYFPDARLIVILREPVARAFSAYSYQRSLGFEPCDDFGDALHEEGKRISLGWHHLWHYASMSRYAGQLDRFVRGFGPDRIKILFYENLELDPLVVAREVFEFLGVESDVQVAPRWFNVSGSPKNTALHSAIRWATMRPRIRSSVRTITPFRMRERIRRANLRHTDMADEVKDILIRLFAPEVRELRILLGRHYPELLTSAPSWLREEQLSVEART